MSKIKVVKNISKIISFVLNKTWFWWTLFILDEMFSIIFWNLLTGFLKIGLNPLFLLILSLIVLGQFLTFAFWILPRIVSNIDLHGHWRGKEIAENIKIHAQLDKLRDAMIFGDKEGEQYWKILVDLDAKKTFDYL
ncbi:MAG: hypothetical protein AB4206_19045 [Xenococcaceae cyanobacterium]